VSTCKGNDIYLHVTGSENPVQLPPIDAKILSAVTLDGVKLTYTQDAKGIAITLPPEARTPIVTEVKLTTDRDATKLAPK
jgi:hypothetical protein